MCDCDSASVCADYDPTTDRADGACFTDDATSACDPPTCIGDASPCKSACGVEESTCRDYESACGVDASTNSGDHASVSKGNVASAIVMFARRVFSSRLWLQMSLMERLRVDALNALSATLATKGNLNF